MKHFKYILLLLPLLYYSCTDDILQDLDSVAAQNEEQDARIDSLLMILTEQQAYIDSLNNIQTAYIDSLINAGSVSDSLLQVYTDSLHNAQQTTLTALANSALSAGFVETEVFSESITINEINNIIWRDLDLSTVVGNKVSTVLMKFVQQSSNEYSLYTGMRTKDSSSNDLHLNNEFSVDSNTPHLFILNTNSSGLIEFGYRDFNVASPVNITISVVFYLN